ncbi:radical SAM protein [Natrinema thermotolerans]|uniref:Radical SAM protein n=1 Tax=Natrinema thermotolerans TaxID=121872 RepID=A0AAF0PD34_9EURY|nr:radical SAM protein [Natrinema thermotolerans]QCC57858.1 radical SAM protein [Natrinema thermotolerans]WMT08950.1 radical SAM protein [Natrinema thermotolerans]
MYLKTERDPEGGWYDRYVQLVDSEGRTIEQLGKHPTLDELREIERKHSVRINLWQQGLVCYECGNQINKRFSSTLEGHLLCWDCATSKEPYEQGDLTVNTDPTKSVLSESKLHEKSLCDYVINVATGCKHGCRFCYVPSTPAIKNRDRMLEKQAEVENPQEDWGSYLLYRDDLPERTHNGLKETDFSDWKVTKRGRGAVMLSSGTDCYQDRRAAQITRGCVHELVDADIPVRILTRSPNVTRDIDLFKKSDGLVTVGMSIPSFDTSLVKALEPQAPPPQARWEALDEMFRAGIPRFVSFSPTYPTMDRDQIRETLSWFEAIDPEVVFHEPMNPRGKNFEMCLEATREAGYEHVAKDLERIQRNDQWAEYAVEHIELVQELANDFRNVTVHSWPDRKLVNSSHGDTKRKLKNMRKQVSPESFASQGRF